MSRSEGRQKRDWDDLAAVDPFWAVLTDHARKHGKSEQSEFFATGEHQVEQTFAVASRLGLPTAHNDALDFGCGLGRLSRALAHRFKHVLAVDISPSLIGQAESLNNGLTNCEFVVTEDGTVRGVADASIDFVYSLVTLQHQASGELIRACIADFVRVLRPTGLGVFQLPTDIPWARRLQPRRRLWAMLRAVGISPELLYRNLGLDPLSMTFMHKDRVIKVVETAGASVLDVVDDQLGGALPSATYYITPSRT